MSYFRDFQTDYGSQQLLPPAIDSFTNNISDKWLRKIRQEDLKRIIIAHLKHQYYKEQV